MEGSSETGFLMIGKGVRIRFGFSVSDWLEMNVIWVTRKSS